MRKHKNPKIDPVCAFCEHATLDHTADEELHIACRYKKTATPNGSCRRFCYDPLKREVHAPLKAQELDPDALLLDETL